jgi:hypothetical protein
MSDMRWSNNSSRIRFEVKRVTNGNLKRLLLVQRFAEGTNFWVHDDGTYSVPTEQEIETLINEEASSLARYLRNEKKDWVPRIGMTLNLFPFPDCGWKH